MFLGLLSFSQWKVKHLLKEDESRLLHANEKVRQNLRAPDPGLPFLNSLEDDGVHRKERVIFGFVFNKTSYFMLQYLYNTHRE